MVPFVALTETKVFEAIRGYLLTRLPPLEIVRGRDNRVPQPRGPEYVVVTPIMRNRLATTIEITSDIIITASIAGTQMTVTDIDGGALVPGNAIWGGLPGTRITSFGTGIGGVGSYTIAPSQTVPPDTLLYAGQMAAQMDTDLGVQIDTYGRQSADNSQIINTLLRSTDACDYFDRTGLPLAPLYCDDAIPANPFVPAESQYENRWITTAHFHLVGLVTIEQQFADTVAVDQLFMADDP